MNKRTTAITENEDFRRFVRFVLVGFVNTAVGYGFFVGFVLLGFGSQTALAVAFALGVLWNYLTHARLVFGQGRISKLPAYCATYLAIWGVNASALAQALRAGLSPMLAQALLAPLAAIVSFFLIARILTGRFPLAKSKNA